jgi:hypothetical protein
VKGEQLVDSLSQSLREYKREERRRDVLDCFDRADGLAGHAGQASELLLREPSLGASYLESIFQAGIADYRLLRSLATRYQELSKMSSILGK